MKSKSNDIPLELIWKMLEIGRKTYLECRPEEEEVVKEIGRTWSQYLKKNKERDASTIYEKLKEAVAEVRTDGKNGTGKSKGQAKRNVKPSNGARVRSAEATYQYIQQSLADFRATVERDADGETLREWIQARNAELSMFTDEMELSQLRLLAEKLHVHTQSSDSRKDLADRIRFDFSDRINSIFYRSGAR